MEEILASIRRIISDEEDAISSPSGAARAAKPAPAPKPDEDMSAEDIDKLFAAAAAGDDAPGPGAEEDVLELSESQAIASDEELMLVEGVGSGDVAFTDPRPEAPFEPSRQAAPQPFHAAAPPVADELPAGPLLSAEANVAVTAAFNNLANTILSSQARTLEDLVKDMLRPMLKSWLDHNLPTLVERLVREEIERVSRGR